METILLSRPVARRVLALAALGVFLADAAVLPAAPWRARQPSARSLVRNYASGYLAADALRPSERAFLDKAVENSRQAMRLAQLAVSQANSTEVRSFAQQLAADHRQLSDAIVSLVRKKGASTEVPVGEGATFQQLAEKSGADFDREFVKLLAPLHDATVTLFEQATEDAKDADVRELAGGYLPTLRDHGNTIVGLKKTLD